MNQITPTGHRIVGCFYAMYALVAFMGAAESTGKSALCASIMFVLAGAVAYMAFRCANIADRRLGK